MKCATVSCEHDATHRVFWPGRTVEVCATCSKRARLVASALGFDVAIQPMPEAILASMLGKESKE